VPPERERQRERETVLRRKASGRKWLNTGSADPTTLGLKWQGVGDTQPTEGRQLTNSMLADALASKTAAAEEQQSTKVVDFTKEDLDLTEEGSLQGRLESEPVSSTDRDRGTRVRG
jgi:hypothetical protein